MGVFTPERRRQAPPPQPPPYEPPREPRRPIPWGLIALGIVIVAVVFGVNWVRGVFPDFDNPFHQQTVDRSGPAVLKSLQDLHSYHAATGNFQQVVDLHQDSGLPDAILGSRTLYIAYGSVDASVDFSNVDEDDVSDDRLTATITLPRPALSPARIDPTRSYVYDEDQGALNEIGDLFSSNDHDQQQLNILAVQKINAAAQQGSGLIARARENTRLMLGSLLSALGFTTVNVVFADEQA
jgi:Protein of unknown function (DUF4230)